MNNNSPDTFFNRLLAVPVLVLFLGAGVLAVGVAIVLITDRALANSVILFVTGAAAFGCGAGLLILSAIVGLAVYRRLSAATPSRTIAPLDDPWQLPPSVPPPALPLPTEGSWTSSGLPSYNLAAPLSPTSSEWDSSTPY